MKATEVVDTLERPGHMSQAWRVVSTGFAAEQRPEVKVDAPGVGAALNSMFVTGHGDGIVVVVQQRWRVLIQAGVCFTALLSMAMVWTVGSYT